MNYQEAKDYLYNQTPMFQKVGKSAYKAGLSNTIALDEHFGHPHKKFKTVHIGGTNGKGSCAHLIASILQESGYKVGLYTSPHLIDFRERIKVNGEMISEDYVIEFIDKERSFFEPLQPSFFEIATAMAYKYFADKEIDVAVVEVGLGGRLDCTNIVNPVLSIITNISKDHTNLLGKTTHEIAYEKAGIIKRNKPIIIGEYTSTTKKVFDQIAKNLNAPIVYASDKRFITDFRLYPDGHIGVVLPWFSVLYCPLGGLYQSKNINTVLCAIELLKEKFSKINSECVERGVSNVIKNTGLMGRWQCVNKSPRVFCDTGHNVGGFEYLSEQIKSQKYNKLRIVLGMVNDKDINGVLSLLPGKAIYYFCQASVDRALNHEQLKSIAFKHNLHGESYSSVEEAYKKALADSDKNDFIFVGGSTFVVADLLKII